MALLLGFDIGSSSVKATLLDAETGLVLSSATSPDRELAINSSKPGWAEQDPETWWEHVVKSALMMKASKAFDVDDVKAIGISYQMHGLVLVGKDLQPLRPSIIWCDSRAVDVGAKLAAQIGSEKCLDSLLNLPGNFTASKLGWVKENEPEIFSRIFKMMLPGDYIAMKMTGEVCTTASGLSEGTLWDFAKEAPAGFLLDQIGVSSDLLPKLNGTFSIQGGLTESAARELGLKAGIPISYRAGDQPNNAFSLNVLNAGEAAVTAGTSGVVYGVSGNKACDRMSRVNVFAHVNHVERSPRYGILLCVNGTGILNSWLKRNLSAPAGSVLSYDEMNKLASSVPVGADGLMILPYGNGAERTLGNRNIGASVHGLGFNTHSQAHFFRAAQEGIVYALNYGLEIMKEMGMPLKTVRAGLANMFQSPLFVEAFATVTDATVELYNTDGSQGAARGAGLGAGIYGSATEAFQGLKPVKKVEPSKDRKHAYDDAYAKWKTILNNKLS